MSQLLHNEDAGTVKRPNPFLVFHQAVDRDPISAIRMGDFKLVKTWEKDRLELFDISRDLSEVDDLSERMPEKTQELHALLTGYLEDVGADIPRGDGKRKRRKKSDTRTPQAFVGDLRDALIPAGTQPNGFVLSETAAPSAANVHSEHLTPGCESSGGESDGLDLASSRRT